MREAPSAPASPSFLTTSMIAALGVDKRARARLVADGSLIRVCKGRYLPPDPPAGEFDALRRLLAKAGPDACACRATAARLWALDGFPTVFPLTVRTPFGSGMRDGGMIRTRHVPDATVINGIALTSPADTLIDLGASLLALPRWPGDHLPIAPTERVERALESALRHGLTDLDTIATTIDASSSRRPGRSTIARVIGARAARVAATESYLETRTVQVLRRGGLPSPRRQVEIRDESGRLIARVDLLIGHVAIQTDGREFHSDREVFERDRRQWSELAHLVIACSCSRTTRSNDSPSTSWRPLAARCARPA